MIQRTLPVCQKLDWQDELRQLVCTPQALFDMLELPPQYLDKAIQAHAFFPVRATRSFVNAMKKGDINDPLLKQVLPLGEELIHKPEFTDTPLEEHAFNPTPGVIHKYNARVLLIAATQCAVNCRYCFRRNFDYQANNLNKKQWLDAFKYIANNTTIEEVILSGGDPLAMTDNQIKWVIEQLTDIKHVSRLRIHTRLPIVLPSRVTNTLCTLLKDSLFDVAVVIHSNHPQEITQDTTLVLKELKKAGIHLLNQSVLLKGINDDAKILGELSKTLFKAGVLPYYLHLLDKVKGASHFDVSSGKAKSIISDMTNNLSGYLVPKLVKEVPHAKSKTAV